MNIWRTRLRFWAHCVPALDNLQIGHFGAIPKKDWGWRLILDLSFPFGHSVNDRINKEDFSLTYSKVSDAIVLIIKPDVVL